MPVPLPSKGEHALGARINRAPALLGLPSAWARRWDWQHSIPPVDKLRYSITFRSLRELKE